MSVPHRGRGRPPLHPQPVAANPEDEEESGTTLDEPIEDQFILRVPLPLAEKIRQILRSKEASKDELEFNPNSRGIWLFECIVSPFQVYFRKITLHKITEVVHCGLEKRTTKEHLLTYLV